MADDLGEVVEGIVELFRVGPVAVAEARVIRSDQVIADRRAGRKEAGTSAKKREAREEKNARVHLSALLPDRR